MKIAVLFFSGNGRQQLLEVSKGLARGLEKQGKQVDLIDGDKDVNVKLTMYQYIAIGTSALNMWGGKISRNITEFIANSGIVSGKRCFAFVTKSGLRKTKTLRALMKAMEHEGMYLKNSRLLSSAEEAEEIGKRLHVG